MLGIVVVGCYNRNSSNSNVSVTPGINAVSSLMDNYEACDVETDCYNAETACTTQRCWLPIACAHEIDEETFYSMCVNSEGSGTVKTVTDISAYMDNCQRLELSDASPNTDGDIVLSNEETSAGIAYYNIALFKGILQMTSPAATTFTFRNAINGSRADIIFKVTFSDNSEKFYDLSEPPGTP